MESGAGYILKQCVVSLGDLFFPRMCLVCGAKLDAGVRHLCADCLDDLPLTYYWSWDGNPAESRLAALMHVEQACSLFFYRRDSGYARLLQEFKYGGDIELGRRMARMLAGYMTGQNGSLHHAQPERTSSRFCDIDAVVPVPLHPLKKFRRGFNQSDIIARELAAALGAAFEPALIRRRRYTRTQTRASDRRTNISGAFAINTRALQRLKAGGIRKILLVDDVLTTGSTIAAVASVIPDSIRISVATIACVE